MSNATKDFPPYIVDESHLDHLAQNKGSSVILTHPGMKTEAVSLGAALQWALRGRTHSFTAIVGYFHHNDQGSTSSDDPASIIISEAQEENVHLLKKGEDFESTAFRLLVGQLSSKPASLAARAWYWTCLWRHCSKSKVKPDLLLKSDEYRNSFISLSQNIGFAKASQSLLQASNPVDIKLDGPFQNRKTFCQNLDLLKLHSDDRAEDKKLLKKHWSEFITELDDLEKGLIKKEKKVDRKKAAAILRATAILYGFFLQRKGELRVAPNKLIHKDSPQQRIATFHPKIYVVERTQDETKDTIAFIGSNNWSKMALGSIEYQKGGSLGNVEVATIHTGEGHLWGKNKPLNMAEKVCATANFIYAEVKDSIGSWESPSKFPLSISEMLQLTKHAPPLGALKEDDFPSKGGGASPPQSVDLLEPWPLAAIAPQLEWLVAKLIGIENIHKYDLYHTLFSEEQNPPLFGGRTPEPYQLDGALRLLNIMQQGSRGAFLTDEAGLGKTLVAKMVATIRITECLFSRLLNGDKSDLLATIIAPARLIGHKHRASASGSKGSDVDTTSGWHAHAQEIRDAVKQSLRFHILEDSRFEDCSAKQIKELFKQLKLRVMSAGAFSRKIYTGDIAPKDYPWKDLHQFPLNESVVTDLLHLARSEVVVIDESHNFRNPSSRATRTLRYALSLPVPGEDWPLTVPFQSESPSSKETKKKAAKSEPSSPKPMIQRKVLCLSATPFNNRLGDIITQIGHFAQYQDWAVSLKTLQKELFSASSPISMAIQFWKSPPFNGKKSKKAEEKLKEAFRTITRHIAPHLYSTRSLALDEEKIQKGEKTRKRYVDKGPEYTWGARGSQYTKTFAAALESSRKSTAPNTPPKEEKELETAKLIKEREARTRLDALLCNLMVQRSRGRVLKMAQATRGAEVDKIFRFPQIPRHPLPLNTTEPKDGERSVSESFESLVLRELYTLISASSGKGDEPTEKASLSMYAYEIGGKRTGGDKNRNSLGFQIINMIKRLQSSPYAFARTLLRGPLRRSLAEIALVERLVAPLRKGKQFLDPLHPWACKGASVPPSHLHSELLEKCQRALKNFVKTMESWDFTHSVSEMIGGSLDSSTPNKYFICELSGIYSPSEARRKKLDSQQQKNFDAHFKKLIALVIPESTEKSGTKKTKPKKAKPPRFKESWAGSLLHDVARKKVPGDQKGEKNQDSKLWQDILLSLSWTFDGSLPGKNIGEPLIRRLYANLNRIHVDGESFMGKPLRQLRTHLLSKSNAFGENENKHLLHWLQYRLQDDPRAASVVAWLLIQSAARLQLSTEEKLLKELPGGDRTLIFSEYTDTQEYILTIITALAFLFRLPSKQLSSDLLSDPFIEFKEELQGYMISVANCLGMAAKVVRKTPSSNPFSKPKQFQSPVRRGAESWFDKWIGDLDDDKDTTLSEAVVTLYQGAARVCSKSSHRLDVHNTAATGDSDKKVQGVGHGPEASHGEDPILDAFSPWYQIAPNANGSPQQQEGFHARLAAAARRPVYTLFSTEVLSEGVNLQECGVIVHYDLPWNPTRLIQRNGRIDRRIFDLYEDDEKREKLINALEIQRKALIKKQEEEQKKKKKLPPIDKTPRPIPPMVRPKQVYHLTLVPAEPKIGTGDEGDADRKRADRVRELLFQKLESIRSLFGLSSWPIVLDQEQAKRVLTGELDYETPGFRRREDLFKNWRILRERRKAHDANFPEQASPPLSDEPQSLTLTVQPDFLEHLLQSIHGAEIPSDNKKLLIEHFPAWSALQSAGVVTWTPYQRQSAPVRSSSEWASVQEHNRKVLEVLKGMPKGTERDALESKLRNKLKGTLNGVLISTIKDPGSKAPRSHQLTTWGEHRGNKSQLFPLTIQHSVKNPTEEEHVDKFFCNLRNLDAAEGMEAYLPSLPNSPTALAEDILISLIEYVMDRSPNHTSNSQHIDLNTLGLDQTLLTRASWQKYMNNIFTKLKQFGPPTKTSKVLAKPTDDSTISNAPAFSLNLWIKVSHDEVK